ncbi:hypothetical protein BD309DRAFT_959943 [Dichomitus squalens]|uniref:Uncharacterized protein n=1 Tax=Dichomitus squalens TaxID=114155 RepID=A0A4Q9PIL0_9APHY|nr:hypothetical protein BD309DRAFT_959943 [Dichomitus squalens]TBU53806.1 hypothetical protein BD310DRAFT_937257 [Dichomitus squalens]
MAERNGFSHASTGSSECEAPHSPNIQPIADDTAHATSRKRKRTEDLVTVPSISVIVSDPATDSPTLTPIILPDIRHHPDEPYVTPPSPVPTEIVEEPAESTPEEYLAATKRSGVKVRDFAYEPRPKGRDIRAPETWSKPLDTLVLHDRYIRLEPSSARYGPGLPGKMLWGLLSTGLVTREEAEINWRPEAEWKAYNAYVNRPQGPHPIALPADFKKPTAAYRKSLLESSFHSPFWAEDVRSELEIYIPPDVEGMVDGPKNLPDSRRGLRRIIRAPPNPQYVAVYDRPEQPAPTRSNPLPALSTPSQPRLATPSASSAGHNAAVNSVHVDKRRRTSGPAATPSGIGASATPPATSPGGTPSNVGGTLSRSVSYGSLSGSSARSETPPVDEAPHRPLSGNLARTSTLSRIPVQ